MRLATVIWLSLLAATCLAQDPQQAPNLFHTVRPDVLVTVSKHNTGADMVTVTARSAKYPLELLQLQVEKMAANVGSEPRGLQVVPYTMGGDPKMTFVRASCAMDGLIDRKNQILHVGAIVKAFAGAPEPYTVDGINIEWYGPKGGGVRAQAQYTPNPPIIEYRIELLSQDPNAVDVPDVAEPKPVKSPSGSTRTGVDWSLWGLLAGAAVAAGALVYSLLLRSGSKPRS
jgi:hypothetical protein